MEGVEDEAKKKKTTKRRGKKRARIRKSFLHFSNALKKLHGHGHGRPSANDADPSPPSSSLLSACMHPRTNSFSLSGRRRHVAATNRDDGVDDADAALAVNFRSLRVAPTVVLDDDDDGEGCSSTREDYGGSGSEGRGVVAGMAAKAAASGGGEGVAVVTFSAAPYEDFRRSMREMADAHARMDAARAGSRTRAAPAVDWDFMEELLFCYLQLNDRAVHKDILRAFTDTVAAMRRRHRAPAPKPTSRRARQHRKGARGCGVNEAVDSAS